MAAIYPRLFRSVIARVEPERAHRLALAGLRFAGGAPAGLALLRRATPPQDGRLRVDLWGLSFANPIGVAAGLDKDAEAVPALCALGFGHVEVGTITPRPQEGNPRPRVWRLPEHRAVINALGFPSRGADVVGRRLRRLRGSGAQRCSGILGINLGKNRDTPLEGAVEDYRTLISALSPVADYFAINISSPNTPRLRELQQGEQLISLIRESQQANRQAASAHGHVVRPLLIKIAPDLDDAMLEHLASGALVGGADGLIATNTTTARDAVASCYHDRPGGLSGRPLQLRARAVIRRLYATVGRCLPIVGVGGVASAADVLGHLHAGASLVQMYTGFVYGGPAMVGPLLRDLAADAAVRGWTSVSELVGYDATS